MPDIGVVRKLLSSDDPDSVREGAHLAGQSQLSEVIPDLVKHLSSHNLGIQDAADRALRKIGRPEVVSAVIPLLRSDEAPERNLAMDLLRELGHTDMKSMESLMLDDDPDIRIFASDILGSSKREVAVPLLCNALLHDPEVNVRYQAAISLGSLAFPHAAESLNKALNDEEWVQFSVIEALIKLRVESSISALMKALDKSSDLVTSMIIDALGEMGSIKAVPMLMSKLSSSPVAICNKIIRAVMLILGKDSLSLLSTKEKQSLAKYMYTALSDGDIAIQDAAIKGLTTLKNEKSVGDIIKLAAKLHPEKDSERRLFITKSLSLVGVVDKLSEAFRTGNESEQLIALDVMKDINDSSVSKLLIDMFWVKERDIQRIIMECLSQQPSNIPQSFLLDVLKKHDDGIILKNALLLLGKTTPSPDVEDIILRMLENEYNDVKESALAAAIALGTDRVKSHFKMLIKDTNEINRILAAYALGQFGADTYLFELKDALQDQSEEIRKVAVESLGAQLPLSQDRRVLIESMLHDVGCEVRRVAVDILGGDIDDKIEALLIERLKIDDDPWVRVRSIEKLATQNTLVATKALVGALGDSNHLVIIKAINLLGEAGGDLAFSALLELLEHPDEEIQEHVALAVEKIRTQRGE